MLELFRSRRRAIVWFAEASLLVLLTIFASGMMAGWAWNVEVGDFVRAAAIALVAQASLYYHGLYGPAPIRDIRAIVWKTLRALAFSGLLLWLVLPGASGGEVSPIRIAAASLGLAALLLPLLRVIATRLVASERLARYTLVLGRGPLADACIEVVEARYDPLLHYAGRLVPRSDDADFPEDILGTYDDLRRIANECGVRHIVVASSDRRGKLPVDTLLDLKFRGVEIEEGIDFYERITGKIFVRELRPSQLIFSHGFRVAPRTAFTKRLLDIVCACIGLVLALPLMLLTAIAIKLDSRGPALYSQERAGEHGRPFTIYKFRSMRIDAEADGKPRFAAEDDPRITRVGRFIRKTRLDELPQLFNVLVGEMSLVGPRPERPAFITELERDIPYFRQRLFVKPGVTGYAQVRSHYGASTEDHREKLEYDLFYIKTLSVWFDLSILLDTVKVVLLRIGAR